MERQRKHERAKCVRAARNVLKRRLVRSASSPHFQPSQLDNAERVEEYRPGGCHPVAIGDAFAQGRYKVVHKLGFGAPPLFGSESLAIDALGNSSRSKSC